MAEHRPPRLSNLSEAKDLLATDAQGGSRPPSILDTVAGTSPKDTTKSLQQPEALCRFLRAGQWQACPNIHVTSRSARLSLQWRLQGRSSAESSRVANYRLEVTKRCQKALLCSWVVGLPNSVLHLRIILHPLAKLFTLWL